MKISTISSVGFIIFAAINLTLALSSDENQTPSVLLPTTDGLQQIDSLTGLSKQHVRSHLTQEPKIHFENDSDDSDESLDSVEAADVVENKVTRFFHRVGHGIKGIFNGKDFKGDGN